MRIIRPISEDEMVLAFVRAEIHSPLFKQGYLRVLGDKSLVYRADLMDSAANARRKEALARVRGYGVGAYLFRGFPDQIDWYLVCVTREELGDFLYARYPTWVELSDQSRTVRDGAANVDRKVVIENNVNLNENIRGVERALRTGATFPPIIVVAASDAAPHIVVEGHKRATALFRILGDDDEVEVILGYSAKIVSWEFY